MNNGDFESGFTGGWFGWDEGWDVTWVAQPSAPDLVRFGATTINDTEQTWGASNNPPFSEPFTAFLSQDNIDLTGVPQVQVTFDYRFKDSGNDSFKLFFGLKENVGSEGTDGRRDLSNLQERVLSPQGWDLNVVGSGLYTTVFDLTGLDLSGKSGLIAFVYDENDQSPSDTTGNDALAVIRTVSVNAIPIPGAVWLLGTGLIGLFGLRRKFQR